MTENHKFQVIMSWQSDPPLAVSEQRQLLPPLPFAAHICENIKIMMVPHGWFEVLQRIERTAFRARA